MYTRLTVRKYNPRYSTHIPMLLKCFALSQGPVLELGMGPASTPLLHQICADAGRKLASYEDDQYYFDRHWEFQSKDHEIYFVKDWDSIPITNTHWGVVLVDHLGEFRAKHAAQLALKADYIVLHDTNGRHESHYHYSTIYPLFKYRYDYTKAYPSTTVLSNFNDLSNF